MTDPVLRVDVEAGQGDFVLRADLAVRERVTAVFGPSGAGKTTLLHVLAGLVRPRRGRIVIGDDVVFDAERKIHVPPHRSHIGVVFQDDRLFPHRSVRGNLQYGAVRHRARGGVTFDEVVDLLEMAPLLARRPGGLSGGERKRVALGRALLSGPRLLLLDEPLAGLDWARRARILPFLARIRDAVELPMLCVSHELVELLQLTDHLVVLDRGRVDGVGRYVELVREQRILEVIHPTGLVNVIRVRGTGDASFAAIESTGASTSEPQRLLLPGPPLPADRSATLSIGAHDVALAPAPVPGISIQNQVSGTVVGLTAEGGREIVEIDIGQPLLCEITTRARTQMGLAPGVTVWCLVKTSAIRRLDGA